MATKSNDWENRNIQADATFDIVLYYFVEITGE
jgi:hypothetical protein